MGLVHVLVVTASLCNKTWHARHAGGAQAVIVNIVDKSRKMGKPAAMLPKADLHDAPDAHELVEWTCFTWLTDQCQCHGIPNRQDFRSEISCPASPTKPQARRSSMTARQLAIADI